MSEVADVSALDRAWGAALLALSAVKEVSVVVRASARLARTAVSDVAHVSLAVREAASWREAESEVDDVSAAVRARTPPVDAVSDVALVSAAVRANVTARTAVSDVRDVSAAVRASVCGPAAGGVKICEPA